MKKGTKSCELCKGEASVYCDADSAFLCWSCDHRVHTANFLVARHVRSRLTCDATAAALTFSGPGAAPLGSDPISHGSTPISSASTSTSVSSCISTADSDSPPAPPPRRRSAAERVMEGWGRAMGLARGRRCAAAAARVMEDCAGEMAAVPLRAAMAAALWFATARVCGVRTCEGMLMRLVRCSGVPAKVIVACEMRIARAAEERRRDAIEEGWGECP